MNLRDALTHFREAGVLRAQVEFSGDDVKTLRVELAAEVDPAPAAPVAFPDEDLPLLARDPLEAANYPAPKDDERDAEADA